MTPPCRCPGGLTPRRYISGALEPCRVLARCGAPTAGQWGFNSGVSTAVEQQTSGTEKLWNWETYGKRSKRMQQNNTKHTDLPEITTKSHWFITIFPHLPPWTWRIPGRVPSSDTHIYHIWPLQPAIKRCFASSYSGSPRRIRSRCV